LRSDRQFIDEDNTKVVDKELGILKFGKLL